MPQKFEYYKDLAERMVTQDKVRDRAFMAYQKMFHCEWDLPGELSKVQWIHKVISTDPHDAISAATRVLSTLEPQLTVIPLANDTANKQRANEIEKNLGWQLKSANRRRPASVVADTVQSALMYAAVAAQVVDIDWQIKQLEGDGKDTKRWKAARRYGRFKVNTYNPQDVHVRYSDLMPEAVLLKQEREAKAVMDEFPKAESKLKKLAEDGKKVIYFDYTDYDTRVIWCQPKEAQGDEIVLMTPREHDLPFLPWVAMMGGSTLENEPEHQYHAMLYSVYQSGQWQTQNSVETLIASDVIANAASPRMIEEGPNTDSAEVNAMEPARPAKVPPGNTLKGAPANQIDPGLVDIAERIGSRIDKSTVSRILMNADVPSGTAYSTLNLATQTAVGALKPYKELAEKALAEIFVLMLLWVEYTEEDLYSYGKDRTDMGMNYVIEADTISPENLYIDVELTPDVPTDRQQRANTAIMLNQAGLYSKERGMEDMGVTDPVTEMDNIALERLKENALNLIIQQQQAALQMGIQQQQAEIQRAQEMEAQAEAQQYEQMMGGGNGYNPGAGGVPPAQMNPYQTRENVTGQDRMGNPVTEGLV